MCTFGALPPAYAGPRRPEKRALARSNPPQKNWGGLALPRKSARKRSNTNCVLMDVLKSPHLLAVIGADLEVVHEWDRGRDLDRDRHDARVGHAEPSEKLEHLAVELRDRHRKQRDRRAATAARDDDELMVDEVEVDLERVVPAGDHQGRQSPRRHNERRVPPMVHQRSQGQTHLSDDLSPSVDRVQGVLPVDIWERRPQLSATVPRRHVLLPQSQLLRHGHAELKRSLTLEPLAAWAIPADWMASGLNGGVACAFGLPRCSV